MSFFDHLPPRATWGGYVYLALFNNPLGTVKIGCTIHPSKRMSSHRMDANMFGHQVVDAWVSQQHVNYIANEQALIALAGPMASGRARSEYFHGIDFEDLMEVACGLTYEPEPEPEQPQIIEARRAAVARMVRDWSLMQGVLRGEFYTFAELQDLTGMPADLVVSEFSGGLLPTGATGEAVIRWVEKHRARCRHEVSA